MTRLRIGLAILFVLGIAGATIGDRTAPPPAPQDGLWILAADFHVHSFLGDGALAPWELAREASRRGLDVIAVTNHNTVTAARMAARLHRLRGGVLVLVAEELTAPSYHISAVGIREPIDWSLPAAQAIDAIHAQGGVAIASHPIDVYARAYDDEALARLDGIEIAHPVGDLDEGARAELDAFYARARTKQPRVAPIGSSDFHFQLPMGLCRTYVLAEEFSERGVLDALRQGRTVAYDISGNAYGDPAFVRTVERYRASRRATAGAPVWAAAGTVVSWAAIVLALAVGGPSSPRPAPRP